MNEKEKVLGMFSKSISESAHRDTLTRVLADGFVPGDDVVVDQLIAPNYVVHSPLGDLDREELKAFLATLRLALADFSIVRVQILFSGDFASTRMAVTGAFSRAFPGPGGMLVPNGNPVDWQIVSIVRFNQAAQIVEEWMQFDYLSLLRQLGVAVSTPTFHALAQA